MKGTIKLAFFIVIYSVSVVLFFYLDDFMLLRGVSKQWQGIVIPPSPIVLTLLVFGFLAKNVKQLFGYSFLGGLILLTLLIRQEYVADRDDFLDWIRLSESWTQFFVWFGKYTIILSFAAAVISGLGMFLSYAYKIVFKSARNERLKLK